MEVLVVEDDPAVRLAFSRALVSAGFRVRTAENGWEALGVLSDQREEPRVIVCDLHMPILDGMGLYLRLRESSPRFAERMLFVTGSAGEAAATLRRAGRPYLSKPIDIAKLVETVRSLSASGGDRRALGERRRAARRRATVFVSRDL